MKQSDICKYIYTNIVKNNVIMSNLQTHCHFKLDFQRKVAQHTGGKWLIHSTEHHKDNKLQSLELPCEIS